MSKCIGVRFGVEMVIKLYICEIDIEIGKESKLTGCRVNVGCSGK